VRTLRGEVQSLLAQQADSFLESSPVSVITSLSPGAKLGNFETVELIGCWARFTARALSA
jgi:hypothetical protein